MDRTVVQPLGATRMRCSPLPERSIFVMRRLAASSATGTVVRSCNGGVRGMSNTQFFFTRWDAAYYMNGPYHMHSQRFLEGRVRANMQQDSRDRGRVFEQVSTAHSATTAALCFQRV
jgi:hypothetical protein